MSCTRQFLMLRWEHHTWRPRVTAAEHAPVSETNMWGRVVHSQFVRCQKQQTCTECGQTRPAENCICDTAHAEQCAIYRAWADQPHPAHD